MVTDPHTQTHPQTGPITIHYAAKFSAQCIDSLVQMGRTCVVTSVLVSQYRAVEPRFLCRCGSKRYRKQHAIGTVKNGTAVGFAVLPSTTKRKAAAATRSDADSESSAAAVRRALYALCVCVCVAFSVSSRSDSRSGLRAARMLLVRPDSA